MSESIMRLIALFLLGVLIGISILSASHITDRSSNVESSPSILIWNDDDETIPKEGALVKIDFIEGNKVYIAPIEE